MNAEVQPLILPQAVIFDCDGVLIDSYDATREFYNRVRAAVGLPPLTWSEEAFVFINTIPDSIRHIIPFESRDTALRIAAEIEFEELLPLIRLQPGLVDLLRFLDSKEIKMGVNTNSGAEAELILESLGVVRYFRLVVTSNKVRRPKPHPEGLLKILTALAVPAQQTVFLGDSELDREAAQAAGIDFWAYKNPRLSAARHVSDYFVLRNLLAANH